MKENKNNILFIIIAFILGLLVMFCIMFFTKEKCEICEKCVNEIEEPENKDGLTSSQKEMFDLLNDYAKKMYDKKEYLNFNKNEQGVYYATLQDISNLNYDVSILKDCDQKNAVVFFDIEHKMSEEYMNEPLQISVTCSLGTKIE